MRVVIVYESMFGNTRVIGQAVRDGMASARPDAEIELLPVRDAAALSMDGVDLLVVGAPTHVHGLSRATTRHEASERVRQAGAHLRLEPGADAPGVREWIDAIGPLTTRAAAFDTRRDMNALISGRASRVLAKALRVRGATLLEPAESFLVTESTVLVPGEVARAEAWGRTLITVLAAALDRPIRG